MSSSDLQRLYKDFVDRYQRGGESISEQEAADRYREVAPQLSPEVYEQSAQEAFARMSPQERAEFGRYLAAQQGRDFIDLNQDGIDDRLQDPDYLAKTTTQAHREEPGLLDQLLGGGHAGGGGKSGGIMGSPMTKGVLGGIAAYGISRLLGGRQGSSHRGGRHGHRSHGHGGFEFDDIFEGGFGDDD